MKNIHVKKGGKRKNNNNNNNENEISQFVEIILHSRNSSINNSNTLTNRSKKNNKNSKKNSKNLTTDDKSRRFSELVKNEASLAKKKKRLENHVWGIGLEHEVYFFHMPVEILDPGNEEDLVKYFIIYDSAEGTINLLKNKKLLNIVDKDFLLNLPFEPSGRKCAGEWVLKPVFKNPSMPEFVTTQPFSSIKTGKRTIESYCQELRDLEFKFKSLQVIDDKNLYRMNKYGPLVQFPFGMCNYIARPLENKDLHYSFSMKNDRPLLHTDYTGSYHFTITLPFDPSKTSKKDNIEFIKRHEAFANQVQWLEPLLITAYFSSDLKAVGTEEKRIRGSYRIMRVGWGNLAGSDIRKFEDGIGRYSNIKSFWRDGLDFYGKNKLKPCDNVTIKEKGAVSALSSNFRTFGSTDPKRPWHRESGAGMNIPNGIELRIFDHFDSEYAESLGKFLIYVAENSRVTKPSNKYVYKNKNWISALHKIMMEGWKAELSEGYIKDLREVLGLKIKIKTNIAYYVLLEINKELFEKNRNGDWTYLMLGEIYDVPPQLPMVNQQSWQLGFILKLNNNKKLLIELKKFLYNMPDKKSMSINTFKNNFLKVFEPKKWKSDILDVIMYLHSDGIIDIVYDYGYRIVSISINKEMIHHLDLRNSRIRTYFKPYSY